MGPAVYVDSTPRMKFDAKDRLQTIHIQTTIQSSLSFSLPGSSQPYYRCYHKNPPKSYTHPHPFTSLPISTPYRCRRISCIGAKACHNSKTKRYNCSSLASIVISTGMADDSPPIFVCMYITGW